MTLSPKQHEYLVLSRGKWDASKTPAQIQQAIDDFYAWHERSQAQGRMKPGHRLATEARRVGRGSVIDGPFTEAKEVIGGYWFIVAGSLEEAAAIAGENPCIACGLEFEIRPLELERASAYAQANETPAAPLPAMRASDTESRARTFFDEFVEAFRSFDADTIAQRYLAPYLAFHAQGSAQVFMSHAETAAYFQRIVDGYHARGCRSCRYKDLAVVPLGQDCALGTVSWELLAEDRSIVATWRESYNLCWVEGRFRAFSSTDHRG